MSYWYLPFPSKQKSSSLAHSPRLLGSRVLPRLRSPASRLPQGRGQGSTWANGSSYHSNPVETESFEQQQQSSHGLVLAPKGEPRRGRGRGVRLRGGGAGKGIRGGQSHAELEEDSEDSSSSTTNSSSSDDDEEEESGQNSGRGGDKENQPQLRREGQAAKEREEDGFEMANQNGADEDEEEEMEQESRTGDRDATYLNKVTLQRPTRAKQDPSAIVPKLEAVAPHTATSTVHSQPRALLRPPIRNRSPCPDQHSNRHTPPQTRSGHTGTRTSHSERLEASKRMRLSRPAKLNNGASSSSSSELPHLRVPLSALQEGGGEAERGSVGNSPSCEREVWVSVFRYLNRADLCICMAVCKNWYKW